MKRMWRRTRKRERFFFSFWIIDFIRFEMTVVFYLFLFESFVFGSVEKVDSLLVIRCEFLELLFLIVVFWRFRWRFGVIYRGCFRIYGCCCCCCCCCVLFMKRKFLTTNIERKREKVTKGRMRWKEDEMFIHLVETCFWDHVMNFLGLKKK